MTVDGIRKLRAPPYLKELDTIWSGMISKEKSHGTSCCSKQDCLRPLSVSLFLARLSGWRGGMGYSRQFAKGR